MPAWDGSGSNELRLHDFTDFADEGLTHEALFDLPLRQFEVSFAERAS